MLEIKYFAPLHGEIDYMEKEEATYKNVKNEKSIQHCDIDRTNKTNEIKRNDTRLAIEN